MLSALRGVLKTLLCHVKAPFGLEKPEDLASDVSLEAAADLGLGLAFRGSSFDVLAGLRMVSEAA